MFRKQSAALWVPPEPWHGAHDAVVVEPYRTQTVPADVVVPLYQALIGASLLGTAAVVVLWLVVRALKLPAQVLFFQLPSPPPEMYVGLFLLVCAIATLWFWNKSLAFARSTIMIQRLEQLTRLDLNHDDVLGHPLRVNALPAKTPAQQARHEFEQFVLDCYADGTTYAALRGQGWKDPQIDRYVTWALENGIGRLKGKTNRSGWELIVPEAEALKIVGRLEWLGKGEKR